MNIYTKNLIFLLFLQLTGIYLFKEGFLLVRLELSNRTTEAWPDQIVKDEPDAFKTGENDYIKEPKSLQRFNKTLLVMIDALRFDFMKYDPLLLSSNTPHFKNKLPILRDLLERKPQNSLLFRGMADPPTTTLQRLMAIMTGALPTLVDAGSNFASAALKEDNLIEKILERGQKVVCLGDDTWDRLFPASINESHFYPSFDVWDLHTVDKGVLSHLIPLLNKEQHDWGLLIAHFLGVDHAGHRYGPGHGVIQTCSNQIVAMGDKLVEMNRVLTDIFEKVHQDTLVIVMGDHGMDAKGDHGGDSREEIDAGLFFYSKTPLTQPFDPTELMNINSAVLNIDPEQYAAFSVLENSRTVQQIDLVPTLALLMGLAIPFGNLGTVIPEFFINQGPVGGYTFLLDVMEKNAKQVLDYLIVYSEHRKDAQSFFKKSFQLYETTAALHREIRTNSQNSDKHLEVYYSYIYFMRHTLLVARAIWSRFEPTLMAMGIIVMAFSLLISLRMYNAEYTSPNFFESSIRAVAAGTIIGIASPIQRVVYGQSSLSETITLQPMHEMIFFASIALMLVWMYHSSKFIDETRPFSKSGDDFETIIPGERQPVAKLCSILLLLYAASVGSDSFLIFEDGVLLHFIQIIHFVLFCLQWDWKDRGKFNQFLNFPFFDPSKWTQKHSQAFIVLCSAIITRIISLVTICRPDQGPYCVPTFNSTPTSSLSPLWTLLPLFFLKIVSIARIFFSRNNHLLTAIYAFGMLLVYYYWAIDMLENHSILSSNNIFVTQRNIAIYIFWPLFLVLLYVTIHSAKDSKKENNIPLMRFTATPFSSLILLLLVLFQKPMGQIVLHLVYIALSQDMVLDPTIKLPLSFLMGNLAFFNTGHQNILSTIQYDLGFIGLKNANMNLSPIFIAINTFGGLILATLCLETRNARDTAETIKVWRIMWARQTAIVVLFAGWFSRHSQAFRVWGPRFLFGVAGYAVVGMAFVCWCLFGKLVGVHHNFKKKSVNDPLLQSTFKQK